MTSGPSMSWLNTKHMVKGYEATVVMSLSWKWGMNGGLLLLSLMLCCGFGALVATTDNVILFGRTVL